MPRAAARRISVRRSMRPVSASVKSARAARSFDTRASFVVGYVRRTAQSDRGMGGTDASVSRAQPAILAVWRDCKNAPSVRQRLPTATGPDRYAAFCPELAYGHRNRDRRDDAEVP